MVSVVADIKPIETNVTLNYEFYNKPVNELQSIYDKLKEEKYGLSYYEARKKSRNKKKQPLLEEFVGETYGCGYDE